MRTMIYRTWRNRRHWTLDIVTKRWEWGVLRWCEGAPCHLPGVRSLRHPVISARPEWRRK